MIEAIYTILAGDMTLKGLLGGTTSDPRIYPDVAPQDEATPFITYRISQDGSRDELIEDTTLTLNINADTVSLCEQISYRLKTLMDTQDQFNPAAENEYIYWSKLIGGEEFYDDEDGRRTYHRVLLFALKYRRK